MSVPAALEAFDNACTVLLSARSDVDERIGTEFRALRAAVSCAWVTCLIYNVMNAAALGHEFHMHVRFVEHTAARMRMPADRWWPGCELVPT